MVKYVATPTSMLSVKGIKPLDGLLYGRIITLSRVRGYCFTKDELLADELNVSTRSIQRSLVRLEKLNYIIRINKYKGNSVSERHIYPDEVYRTVALKHRKDKKFPDLFNQVSNLEAQKKDIASDKKDYFQNIIDEYFKLGESP
ncbi:helix-turn-helix domain-containing protein [Ligilactobacillus aviarius]|uniref:Uncharacterized protein n=1 Tax=Ligilactobacillus aviarius TaxID=1606 RepID=A0A179C510_9LACO|nr:HTH domain-containing protein [Ligilactobacillus aviarius]OAP99312.1 hypothetical protein A3O08_05400 [Ligilactobacillus aviarius]OAQ00680.1 hypothetical protein A3O07_02425 [Ligilactobacillus aviarius]OAQ01679.1 hypothetical protein A3O09_01875 [Ligilactobacillus aviarius]OAQ02436.1 hypothetical protein A3O13_00910 [Ligilactobacillus aviarius]OAQ07936.1 hypothetical protein A3O14_04820 [Ligilactobacillus aviarius]